MTIQQLTYFLAALEHGSFSAAADVLHMAQPSLSEQVRRLEAELGVRLFQRGGRGLVPTEAGRSLREHAQRVLDDVEGAREAVAETRELRGGTARSAPGARRGSTPGRRSSPTSAASSRRCACGCSA